MRMWNVDPKLLCNKHLRGEHVEMHMFVGSLRKGRSIQGHIDKGQVEPRYIFSRHLLLAKEMVERGMNHKSELPQIPFVEDEGKVDVKGNLIELARRCEDCRRLQNDI